MYCSATIPPYCQRCWWIDFHKLVSDIPRELSTFLPRITWRNTFMFMYLQQLPSPLQHYYFWIASPWWRHQMETFSASLAICAGNSPVSGEFPAQRPVTRSFDVFFDLRLDGRLSKHSWGWWLETPSCPLWRQSNAFNVANFIRHLSYHLTRQTLIVTDWLWTKPRFPGVCMLTNLSWHLSC